MNETDSQTAILMATIVRTREIIPICLAAGSEDLRYLIVHPMKSGGRRMLTAYTPSCVQMPVASGFSLIFFPHVGQKNAVLSTGDEQNGHTVVGTDIGSTSIS